MRSDPPPPLGVGGFHDFRHYPYSQFLHIEHNEAPTFKKPSTAPWAGCAPHPPEESAEKVKFWCF